MRRRLALVALCAVLATANTACSSGSGPSGGKKIYAYLTSAEFAVMSDAQTVAKASGEFGRSGGIVWTPDGRFVAAVKGSGGSVSPEVDVEIVVIDTSNGSIASLPCNRCFELSAFGGNNLAVFERPNAYSIRLAVYDLTKPSAAPVERELGLTAAGRTLRVLASDGATALVVLPPNQLYVLRPDSNPMPLETDIRGETISPSYAAIKNTRGEEKLAVVMLEDGPGGCDTADGGGYTLVNSYLAIADGKTLKSEQIDITPLRQGRRPGLGLHIRDLWYAFDGALYVSAASYDCTHKESGTNEQQYGNQFRLWKFTNGSWTQTADEPTIGVRAFEDGSRLVVLPADDIGALGELHFESTGKRTAVASNVINWTVRPS